MIDPVIQVMLLTLLGFFTGAMVAIEGNPLFGIGIAVFSIIFSAVGCIYYSRKQKNALRQEEKEG